MVVSLSIPSQATPLTGHSPSLDPLFPSYLHMPLLYSPTLPTDNTTGLDESFESLEEEGSFLSDAAISPQRQKMVEKVEKTVRDLLQSERSALQVWWGARRC